MLRSANDKKLWRAIIDQALKVQAMAETEKFDQFKKLTRNQNGFLKEKLLSVHQKTGCRGDPSSNTLDDNLTYG